MVFLDGIIFSLQRFGGISNYIFQLVSNSCHEVEYVMSLYGALPEHYASLPTMVDVAPSVRQRILERYRACHIGKHSAKSIFHSSYYRLPIESHSKVVTTVHDFTYEKYRKGAPRALHSWQKRRAIDGADVVICVSTNTKRDLVDLLGGRYEERIVVIPNGVSDVFRTRESSMEQISAERPFLLFVGWRSGYKRFDIAVDVVAQFVDLQLVAVGGGELSRDERECVDTRIRGRFKHCQGLNDEKLCQLYNDAVALIYPSEYEGFGIPVLEAMQSGCPVIARNSSSIPEVVGMAGLLAERSDVEEFVALVESLYSKTERRRIIDLGLERSELFSWKKCAEETVDVYRYLQ